MIYFAIILILVVGAFILNVFYKRTNHYNNQFLDVRKIQNSVKNVKKYDIVNLGSNHPKFAFDYSVIPDVRGTNWAIGPQTFEYDFAVLRRFRPSLADNAIVLLPICLKNFFLYRQEKRSIHAKYYTFLPKEDIVNYSFFEKIRLVVFPLLFNPKLLKYIFKDVKTDNRMALNYNPMTREKLQEDANFWINCWDRDFGVSSTSFNITDKNKSDITKNICILQNTISYCVKEGLRPVICLIPVSNYLANKFSDDYLQKHLYNYINQVLNKDVPFFDYLNDKRFTDSKLYFNSFFFNLEGRKMFTKIFFNDLKESKLI